MIIYSGNKSKFLTAVAENNIATELENTILKKMHRRSSLGEIRSWENSLTRMAILLKSSSVPETAGIAIEYNIPPTGKRVDFMLSGFDENNSKNVVIVELKQWDSIELVEKQDALVRTYVGGAMREVAHPSYQAWSYRTLIEDYNSSVYKNKISLYPLVYLHNYPALKGMDDPLFAPQYRSWINKAPLYTLGDASALREFLEWRIRKGDNEELIKEIEHGKIHPSKKLQDAIVSMVKLNPEFTLIDEQKVVYENAKLWAKESKLDNKKRVMIVKGGPGTGKSVVAINLLAELTNSGLFVQYTSKNSAPRQVYQAKLKRAAKQGQLNDVSIDNFFVGPGSFLNQEANTVDVVIADEAHRLNEKSGIFHNLGHNQIDEIIRAAKFSIFFIDESQRVTMNDIGSIEQIEYWAEQNRSIVHTSELFSQFRCDGSDGYLAWLDDVLQIRQTSNFDLEGMNYDFKIFDNPESLREAILAKNQNNINARIVAGYCWEWPKAGRAKSNVHDIKIDDFEMSWNLEGGQAFAIDSNSINQVGCIHTVQGLEFDYVGVIIGPDLVYRNGKIITDFNKRAKSDQSLKGIKSLARQDPELAQSKADEIIKNTYRTLMTRGMKGCYVYCCDKNLSAYLKERLQKYEES